MTVNVGSVQRVTDHSPVARDKNFIRLSSGPFPSTRRKHVAGHQRPFSDPFAPSLKGEMQCKYDAMLPPGVEPAAGVERGGVVVSGRHGQQRRRGRAGPRHVPQRARRRRRLAHAARPRRAHAQLPERVVPRRVDLNTSVLSKCLT